MKRQITALLVVVVLFVASAVHVAAAGPSLTTTEAYCIMDADSGLVLAQQNMNEELHPASITKVMTLGLACEKADGDWDTTLTVSHEDVYSLAGTDSSHIALQEGEEVPLEDALYGTMMASANDGANLLAEYFGGGTIAGGVEAMNAQVAELGLEHTHFANPHGISDDDHYTSCYDMAVILRWALQQPGFETLFTRNETYTMAATNKQPTRYFSQQDKMRIGSSKYHISEILGSKIGYTNIARYTYVSLAEKDGVRLICVTMRSEMKTDKYADVATLLDYAFSTWTGSTAIEADNVQQAVTVYGGGDALGQVTVSDPGISLLLADGLSAADISVELEVPERWVLGTECEAYAVYTLNGRGLQENTSVRVAAKVEGLEELFAAVDSTALDTADDVAPHKKHSVMIWIFGGVGVLLVLLLIVYILLERRRRRIIRARRAARRARIYGTTPQRQRSRSTSNERNMNRSAHDRQQSNRKQKTTRK